MKRVLFRRERELKQEPHKANSEDIGTMLAEDQAKKQRRKRIYQVTSVFACVVAFATTYSLILPAITAEKPDMSGPGEAVSVAEANADSESSEVKVGDIVEIKGSDSEDAKSENASDAPMLLSALKDKVEETVSLGDSTATGETASDTVSVDAASENDDTHLGIVVETGVDDSDESVVLVAEMTEESGVQLTPMSVEEETVTVVDAEVAEEHPDLEEEVQEILDTVKEEEVLEPEAVEELTEQVKVVLEDITSSGGGKYWG